MRTFKSIIAIFILTQLLNGCLLTKGRFTKDGSMWVWHKDPNGKYNAHNPLQIDNASKWVDTILNIPGLKTLQIEITSDKWDNYKVNDSIMFFNLKNQELPNYHSYYTFARRLNIEPDLLKAIVLDFDKLGLNRFYREKELVAFNTVTYLGYSKGYFYFRNSAIVRNINSGDTLDFRNGNDFKYFRQALFDKFLVLKKYNDHWIEWEEIR